MTMVHTQDEISQVENQFPILGWREWLALPDLGLKRIKVKVDTGARTSALHAFYLDPFIKGGEEWVRFGIHPEQNNTDLAVECVAKVKDKRVVTDSGGHRDERYVIETSVKLGKENWMAEITLTNRDSMKFRMLLGRTAIAGRYVVNPEASYLLGRK